MKDNGKRGGGGGHKAADGVKVTNGERVSGKQEEDGSSFPVKIQGAGVETFEMQAHGFWHVEELLLELQGREELAPRTSLSLSLSGNSLDPLAKLRGVKGLKAGATLRLVEEPYSPRSARAHLTRVQEILRAAGPHDDFRDGRSPSVLNTLTHTHPTDAPHANHGKNLKRSSSNTKTEQPSHEAPPPDYILPGAKDRPPMAVLLPLDAQSEVPSCLLDLSLSSWNPPPGPRKLQGDFFYLGACTREGRHCDITSCPRGFFLNRSTLEVFDPRPVPSSPVCHCLTDLLCQLSPEFKQSFTALRSRAQRPPEESLATPYRVLSWLGPASGLRSHRHAHSSPLAPQEHMASQAPDWNEELQAARDLPHGSLEERLERDRAVLQVNSAFVCAATQGAELVIDGCVDPVSGGAENPAFLWGGVFMSQGGAAGALLGGERGRRAAQRLELSAVQVYSELDGDLQGLRTLPTAVVDYRGVRVSAQGLAPGLHGLEQAELPRGLLYGYSAGPQENPHRRKLLELLAQSAKSLSLQRHAVVGPAGHQVPLFTSVDAQGLLGADGRYYLLDVFRTMPADANFLPVMEKAVEAGSVTSDPSGPTENNFAHGLCRLRPELVRAFIQYKHAQFLQRVRERMEESGGVEECVNAGDCRGTDAVRGACKDVGSISDIIFEMRFNPNVFTPGVEFPGSESRAVELQERLLREAAAFITTHQIPAFLEDCLHCNEMPLDGATLCHALHERGINLRYLGLVTAAINQSEHRARLRHIQRLAFGEIVVRCTRRAFNSFIQGVEVSSLTTAISHFLCCLLVPHYGPASAGEENKKRSRRRGRGGGGSSDSTVWSSLSGNELWSLVCQDAKETYCLTEGLCASADHLVEQYGLQKMSLLRELCLKTGIQIRLRDYVLDNRNKAPVGPDDVLNMLPVVKHVSTTTHDATRIFHAGQATLQKGLLGKAYEQLKEAAYLFGRVCDDFHPDACSCLSLLARVAYLQGRSAEARSVQLRVVVISERVLGFDHPNTIQQYALLAVYMFAGGETSLAQRCLYRARLLMLLVHGEDHPYIATLDSSLGLLLQGEPSLQYLQNALRVNTFFRGAMDLTTALNHHLLAQRMCVAGDYRGAMTHEREALSAFQSKYGDDHRQTHCSSLFLKAITQQAVRVERSLRQGGPELSDAATPEALLPSLDTTLEQLALVNGILKTSYGEKLTELMDKLKEKKVTEEAANSISEPQSPADEGEAGGQTNRDDSKEANPTEGPAQERTAENPESQEGKSDSPEQKVNGQLEVVNGTCERSDSDEEKDGKPDKAQSTLTNGEIHRTSASEDSGQVEPKVNGELR
ncbi:clustered mitochondria protein homolog [Denticeps clupeoides]|uniref:Clu domain-containing protein n=1 Tax=Denticeps clupeoides TaxID=299321 RepID=A0AAY4DV93_9TELE|nr:clustered mitochondria protein homolog [Denticeps clupeoides]